MPAEQNKTISLRYFIVPTIAIIVTFVIGSILAVRGIHKFSYSILEQQSSQYAENYAHQIAKSAEALKIINELLEDKLLTAINSVALYGDNVDDDILTILAESLDVDEIYYYNLDGQILYSNQRHYIGWTPYPGHPVENFLLGDQLLLIEDIRPDTESGILNKYSYIRTPQGFFQVGIRADRVDRLLDAFEPSLLLAEMAREAQVDTICLLNRDLVIQSSSNPDLIGLRLEEPSLLEILATQTTHSMPRDLAGERVYQVFAPVYLDGIEVGILGLTTSLEGTQRIIRTMTVLGILAITIVFGSLGYGLYVTYGNKKQLLEMAFHDSSSGLPNRRHLLHTLFENKNPDTAILLVHIRNFTDINHLHGFHFGNALFKTLANHLQKSFTDRYKVFHVADNRLVFYVSAPLPKQGLIALAKEIIEITAMGIEEQGFQSQLDVRVAIVEIPHPQADPEKIFTHASVALMHLGDESEQPYVFFNQDMEERLRRTDVIERELRKCLAAPNPATLWVEYQPIVDLRTNKVVYFEALTRMRVPELGMIPPPEFIGIAESQQLGVRLGTWVLAQACKFLGQLQEQGFGEVLVSINVSATELLQSGFFHRMQGVLQHYNISPHMISMEITESVIMRDFDAANAALQQLRNVGVQIAIDDFGTGYSSFARVENLNVDTIKIDKYFVDKILTTKPHRLVIGDLVSMCHRLGLQVVAEGVEEEKQREYLLEHHCNMMQGYLFSKSLAPIQALEILRMQNRSTG
ncbi:MAG TPA: hypothetical protein DDZ66_00760 [Firmicutes bacterium]|jgi:EAL domain-containing protein (putative c-di-GMP-specific phosphodiesterase class I)/GGDEF domain-containing protein|nr:hypothetical protein [Bacillota bacterium]